MLYKCNKEEEMAEIYMYVTDDKYQIPIAIADTMEDLAEQIGVDAEEVKSAFINKSGKGRRNRYRKVKIKDDADKKKIEAKMLEKTPKKTVEKIPKEKPKEMPKVYPTNPRAKEAEPGKVTVASNADIKFVDYFQEWTNTYKKGAVRPVTLHKYEMAYRNLCKIIGDLKVGEMDRRVYQSLINSYAEAHEKATCYDFHHIVKACILDAVDEGLIPTNPTRKVVIKGKQPRPKKIKFLSEYELKKLIEDLTFEEEPSWDWLIYLISKTGLRFSEALAVTPNDFDFEKLILNIDKTWNYKNGGGFDKTKNITSVRKVAFDWTVATKFSALLKRCEDKDKPIFTSIAPVIYNSTINDVLRRHCENAGIPVITVHGLRHTHASILLANGVSVLSVSKRLGHSSITTTQKVYLHIIQELENKDTQLIMTTMSGV